MDSYIRVMVEKIWEERRNQEYDIIESITRNNGYAYRFLEVGCGCLGLLTKKDRLLNLFYNSFGVDIDLEKLSKNRQVRYRICGNCYNLPLKTSTFSIIVCRWVFEHLENPAIAIQEFSRILKKGGYLFITTPNLLNYTMLISKFTPITFHNWIRGKLQAHGNIPTYYRANTKWKIANLALQNGFVINYLDFTSLSFMYYRFNKHLFFIMKKISDCISKLSSQFHLKITCLMQKKN